MSKRPEIMRVLHKHFVQKGVTPRWGVMDDLKWQTDERTIVGLQVSHNGIVRLTVVDKDPPDKRYPHTSYLVSEAHFDLAEPGSIERLTIEVMALLKPLPE